MIKDKYYIKAKEIYENNVQEEIQSIARRLREEEKEKKLKVIQDKCEHLETRSTNHGYHNWCVACGKDV